MRCEMFREDAQKIVEDYEQALSHIAHYRDGVSSVIRIGFLLGSYGSSTPPTSACRRYHELHPEVEFSFSVLDIGEMQEALNDNLIDIGFTLCSPKTYRAAATNTAACTKTNTSWRCPRPTGLPTARAYA